MKIHKVYFSFIHYCVCNNNNNKSNSHYISICLLRVDKSSSCLLQKYTWNFDKFNDRWIVNILTQFYYQSLAWILFNFAIAYISFISNIFRVLCSICSGYLIELSFVSYHSQRLSSHVLSLLFIGFKGTIFKL